MRKIVMAFWVLSCLPAGARGELRLWSPAFQPGAPLLVEYTAQGANVSPPLSWSNAPRGTVGYLLICTDTDAPSGAFTHWVCANIPASVHELPRGSQAYVQGKNDFGKTGYGGPDPPKGKVHHYHFRLLALSSQPKLSAHPTRAEALKAVGPFTLGETDLVGVYSR